MPKRAGRPSVAQTPAPKSDKIQGSKKNPKGSATEKKAKSIQLSDKTINTLKEKLDTFKKSHPSKKNIDLNDLKAVYRRGSGAYSSSHRPTITGGAPNSRAAWSYARVNKFLKKAGGTKVKAAYVQDDDLMANGGVMKGGDCYEAAGQFCMGSVFMPEPIEFVGEPHLVHAEVKGQGKAEGIRFGHAWVEDDENVYDYSNGRRIVMPKVVYYAIGDIQSDNPMKYQRYTFSEARAKMLKTKHYGSWDIETEYADGGLIAPNGKPSNLTAEQYKLVRTPEFKAWFGDWENDPENSSKVVDENGEPMVVYHGSRKKVFYEFKNYYQIKKKKLPTDRLELHFFSNNKDKVRYYGSKNIYECFLNMKNPLYYATGDGVPEEAIFQQNKDGFIMESNISSILAVPNSQQIKLADGTNKTFDSNNPDIRFEDGGVMAEGGLTDEGETSQLVTCINCSWQWETADSAEFDKYVCHQCGFDNSLFYDGGLLKPTMPLDQIAEKHAVSIEYLEEQLNKGLQHEKEHTDSDEVATSIALHHLAERPDYYEELEKLELEDGGELDVVILEDNSPEEYEIVDFLKQQREEAHMVMTCDGSKIYKAMICKTKCEIADKRMAETEDLEEMNAWLHYKNTWNDCLQDILDDNIEMYKAGGKTCGCGCDSIYSKGGLAFANGGLAYGNSHDKGGMPLTVKSTGQNIEIEGGEGVVNKRSMQSAKKVEFQGKQMTPCEAVSKINEMGGGVKFKCNDVKNIIAEDGQF